jgi:hypothetical protein
MWGEVSMCDTSPTLIDVGGYHKVIIFLLLKKSLKWAEYKKCKDE